MRFSEFLEWDTADAYAVIIHLVNDTGTLTGAAIVGLSYPLSITELLERVQAAAVINSFMDKGGKPLKPPIPEIRQAKKPNRPTVSKSEKAKLKLQLQANSAFPE
ncbi:hypothetical protein HMPREF3152_00330 [Actinomyces sp. HMSC06A08]|uniref:Uncharacterized protein n=1 Tax=Winkia neuii TaxID=33007 RepID=A0A2I1IMM0_9ACTO|nr:hypothetical protein HMPREF2851_00020 [Actinomyces sp. HMSC064C12]OFT56692.1 hypothetical protein HMPREF3152_00330 [Actinomyces sp. HMSC06A08]PKY72367.1 hypothetical protein CYJ19_05865 [Winkia neuii]